MSRKSPLGGRKGAQTAKPVEPRRLLLKRPYLPNLAPDTQFEEGLYRTLRDSRLISPPIRTQSIRGWECPRSPAHRAQPDCGSAFVLDGAVLCPFTGEVLDPLSGASFDLRG